MSLLIKIVDGKPVNHPTLEQNLLQYYAEVPPEYEVFFRIPRPADTVLTVYPEDSEYQFIDGAWRDVWIPLTLTQDEINQRVETATNNANTLKNHRIDLANQQLLKITDPVGIQVWQNYIVQLQAWTIETIEPLTPELPKPPKRVDGVWTSQQ